MPTRPPLRIPLKAVLIDVIGALLCGYGVYGLVEPDGAGAPPQAAAIAFAAVGAGLMIHALLTIMRRIREQVRSFPPEP